MALASASRDRRSRSTLVRGSPLFFQTACWLRRGCQQACSRLATALQADAGARAGARCQDDGSDRGLA
eukprot:4632194-Pyramimonas_sp.AAC.1